MPKELLTGTLEEQCEFLYDLAREKMAQGNYTGAAHALAEVVRHAPNFRDAPELLIEAKARKALQRRLLIAGLGGAIVFVGFGTVYGLPNDLYFLALAALGAVIGYVLGNLWESYRHRPPLHPGDDRPGKSATARK